MMMEKKASKPDSGPNGPPNHSSIPLLAASCRHYFTTTVIVVSTLSPYIIRMK